MTWIQKLDVRPRQPRLACISFLVATPKGSSSLGGCLQPKVMLLDEPTQGVDVGAKEDIHSADRGGSSGRLCGARVLD